MTFSTLLDSSVVLRVVMITIKAFSIPLPNKGGTGLMYLE